VRTEVQRSVVILYEHSLLGEGIAKYLRGELGVQATVASANDLNAVKSALAHGPAVVIFQLSESLRQLDLAALAPQADLIDVSAVVTRGTVITPDAAGLERILQAVMCRSVVSHPAKSCCGETLTAPAR